MKKLFVLITLFLFISMNVITSTVGTVKEKTTITTLGSPGYIQDLIDNASDGDTIYIPSGTYYENIYIDKSISLIGEDKETTIIDGGDIEDGIYIYSPWVNISGFTLKDNGYLGIITSNKNTISGNILISNDISMVWNLDTKISDNILIESGIGVYECGKLIIDDNTIYNYCNGLSLSSCWGSVSDSIFSNNSFFNSGIYIDNDINIHNNTFYNNTVNGRPFVFIENKSDIVIDELAGQIILIDCNNITIKNQQISNTNIGIHLRFSNNCYINNNTISSNQLNGLYLDYSNNNTISGNMISKNENGINIYGSNNNIEGNTVFKNNVGIKVFGYYESIFNTITGNTILDNNDGIMVYSATTIITDNIIEDNNKNGIWLDGWGGYSSNIYNNTITNNEDGICLNDASNCDIKGNFISINFNGISLNYRGHDNNISDNNITNNYFGIQFKSNLWDRIINNTIFNNTITSNNEEGIIVSNCSNNLIMSNYISENEDGIELKDSNNNIICGNTINSNHDYGIEITASFEINCTKNTIDHNIISSNNKGIYFEKANNNSINNNNFLKNNRHALFYQCTNIWESNYWNRPRVLPKIIFGRIGKYFLIPWFNIDWHPALKPYDIEV